MKLKPYIIVLFAGLISCQSNSGKNEESEFFHIDVPTAIETQKDIPLSEIAEDITYIPLETNPEGLLVRVSKVVSTTSALYVSDNDKLLKFTPEGKFIRQIGKKGNGPGELNSLYGFFVAEDSNSIFLSDFNRGILKFDTAGNYQKTIETGQMSTKIEYCEPDKMVAWHTEFTSSGIDSYVQLTDFEFNSIAKYKNRVSETGSWSIGIGSVYQYDNSFYYRQSYNDTVYKITTEKLEPQGIIAIGEYQFPNDFSPVMGGGDPAAAEKARSTVKGKLAFYAISESDNFMIIKLTAGVANSYENPPIILYNKKTKQATATNSSGFINDLDNGVPFIPRFRADDNTYLDYIDAYELKTKIQEKSTTEVSDELTELATNLDENDNPVLMLVKLK